MNPSYGIAGCLQSATEQFWVDGGWSTTESSYYYRYVDAGGSFGLSMALTPQEVVNAGGLSNVENASNSALAPYAGVAFQYNAQHQVSQATIDGLYNYNYSYAYSTDQGAYGGIQTPGSVRPSNAPLERFPPQAPRKVSTASSRTSTAKRCSQTCTIRPRRSTGSTMSSMAPLPQTSTWSSRPPIPRP